MLDYLRAHSTWPTRQARNALIGATVAVLFTLWTLAPSRYTENNFDRLIGSALFLSASIYAYWLWYRRLPAPPSPGERTIALAVYCRDDKLHERAASDLIEAFEQCISSVVCPKLKKIELPRWLCIESEWTSYLQFIQTRWRKGSRGPYPFLLAVRILERRQSSLDHYVIDLRVSFEVPPFNKHNVILASQESRELESHRTLVPKDDELSGLKSASNDLGLSIQYLVGVVDFISGRLDLAKECFESIDQRMKSLGTKAPSKTEAWVFNKQEARLRMVYMEVARQAYEEWVNTGSSRSVAEFRHAYSRMSQSWRDSPDGQYQNALCIYLETSDPQATLSALNKVRGISNQVHKTATAFALAALDRADDCLSSWNALRPSTIPIGLGEEILRFSRRALNEHGTPAMDLHIALALERAINDSSEAQRAFLRFLGKAPQAKSCSKARKYAKKRTRNVEQARKP